MKNLFEATRKANKRYAALTNKPHSLKGEQNALRECEKHLEMIKQNGWLSQYSDWSDRQALVEKGIIAK